MVESMKQLENVRQKYKYNKLNTISIFFYHFSDSLSVYDLIKKHM